MKKSVMELNTGIVYFCKTWLERMTQEVYGRIRNQVFLKGTSRLTSFWRKDQESKVKSYFGNRMLKESKSPQVQKKRIIYLCLVLTFFIYLDCSSEKSEW